MTSTIIIDDEPLAIKLLAAYVDKHPGLSLVASFTNPIDGLEHLRSTPTDLLLLDIQMPELNGLHVARLVRGQSKVIFTTAYEDHALEGFDLDATDYLLKPISYERFCRAVAKVTPPATSVTPASVAPPASLFVKSGNRTLRLELADLTHGSSSGDYLTLHLSNGTKLLTLENLTDFLARLPADRFCRIHRSHFVARRAITFVERRRVVIGETWLPVSDGYREDFMDWIG